MKELFVEIIKSMKAIFNAIYKEIKHFLVNCGSNRKI